MTMPNQGGPTGPPESKFPRLHDPSSEGDSAYHGGMRTPDPTTVKEVIDWFLTEYTSTSDEALTEIRRILKLFSDKFGPMRVDQIGGADLRDFVKSQPRVAKANTVGRWYRTIKQPFNQAEKINLITRSPFKMVKLPRGDEGRDLTPVEFRALLRLATPVFRRVLVFCRFCGARPKELRTAIWPMVNWNPKGTTVVHKRHKTTETQTERKSRKLYMPVPLVKLLLWLKARSTSDYIFVNSFGGPWKTRALCKNLSELRDKAGFDSEVRLYGCRHMFATQAILNGSDLAEVQEMMGHANMNTTKRYIHLAGKDEHMFGAVEKAVGRKKPSPEKPPDAPAE